MSFLPTSFRPLARGGWGGRAASFFRGLQAINSGQGRGQVGTVVYRSPGGFANFSLSGTTRDSSGAAIAGCEVDLCQGNVVVASLVSDGSGNFTFLNPGSGPFFLVAYKVGSPDVAGTTVNTLYPTKV